MKQESLRRMLWGLVSSLFVTATLAWSASAQEPANKEPAEASRKPAAEKPAVEKATPEEAADAERVPKLPEFRGRLPNYYGRVVSQAQREEIYDIQRKYFYEIEELKAQLETLENKRDKQVAAVLSDEQRAEVAELQGRRSRSRNSSSSSSESSEK